MTGDAIYIGAADKKLYAFNTSAGAAARRDRLEHATLPARDVADYPPHTIPQAVARHFGMFGPNYLLSNACAAGSFASTSGTFSRPPVAVGVRTRSGLRDREGVVTKPGVVGLGVELRRR